MTSDGPWIQTYIRGKPKEIYRRGDVCLPWVRQIAKTCEEGTQGTTGTAGTSETRSNAVDCVESYEDVGRCENCVGEGTGEA